LIRKLLVPSLVGLGLVAMAATTEAVAPPTFNVVVTAQTSTPVGVVPASPGASGNWQYLYVLNAPGTLVDSIPVQLCVTGIGAGQSLTLKFGPNGSGGNLSDTDVAAPLIPTFTVDGCTTVSININVSGLAVGTYNKNVLVQVDDSVPSNAHASFDGHRIQIQLEVLAAVSTQCFITDSDFNYLTDCAGTPITSGNLGRFTIVANKKNIEVATNPGQFYYNVLYTNLTGSSQTIRIDFSRSGVNPQGAQAIHALVFTSLPALSAGNFGAVNDAIPSGKDDRLESVVVPAGYTLWVDYHLEWSGLGGLAPGAVGLTCPTSNQPFSISATLSDGVSIVGACSAGASGYKK
jgi:hypothetical protein